MEEKGDITITSTQEWYYPDGKFDAERVKAKWQRAVKGALSRGKKGLRAFGDVSTLLKDGYAKELVEYETKLGNHFEELPFTVVCAYKVGLVASKLDAEQLSSLRLSHRAYRDFGYNVLENPLPRQHIALLYETPLQRDVASARYINEGLKRNQLCVYASVHVRDGEHMARFSKLISDFDRNVQDGNLIVVDLSPYYISALSDELRPFEDIKKELASRAAGRADRHVRLSGDAADLLFRNRHFDECARLEAWWDQKPFEGSYMCPYPRHMLNKFPHALHKFRIFANHDVVADADGNIMATYAFDNTYTGKQLSKVEERKREIETRD